MRRLRKQSGAEGGGEPLELETVVDLGFPQTR
jgi:hypothetical protein